MIKRWASLFIALFIILSSLSMFSLAEDESDTSSTDVSEAVSEETSDTPSGEPGIISGNAVVAYCLDDEQFLYIDRGDESVAPTVATKLVAMMVVSDIFAEKGLDSANTEVTVTSTAIDNSGDIADFRIPMMGFKAGSVYNAKDLISATLVANANDACAALACYCGELLGGNIITFVDRMNAKVRQLGLENTKFVNPTGLDAPNQVTTPKETALIASAFYRYNELVALSDVESFHFNNKSLVRSKNYLKSNYYVGGYLNKNAIGLIAGQKDKNGDYCLITASQKDGRTYIFVVMCASGMLIDAEKNYSFGYGNAYIDMNKLIEWVRESFEFVVIATADTIVGELRVVSGDSSDHVMIVPATDIERLVVNSQSNKIECRVTYDESIVYKSTENGVTYDTVDAPVTRGMKVGTVAYYSGGVEIASVDAVARESVDSDTVRAALNTAKNVLFGDIMMTILKVLGVIIVLYVIVAVTMAAVRAYKRLRGSGSGKAEKPKKKSDKKAKKTKKDKLSDTKQA